MEDNDEESDENNSDKPKKSKDNDAKEDVEPAEIKEESKATIQEYREVSKAKVRDSRMESKVRVLEPRDESTTKKPESLEESMVKLSQSLGESMPKISDSLKESTGKISGSLEEALIKIPGSREKSLVPTQESMEESKLKLPQTVYIESKNVFEPGVSSVPHVVSNSSARYAAFNCSAFLQKRNPFIHDPPQPEERRPRIDNPSCPTDYLINLREDLADFQESHGLPRTRDYSFLSLGLALAQETARALCSLFFMFVELFPIIAIVSLILRFSLDKLIEILETTDPAEKVKKSLIFCCQMLLILIPLWIFVGTIILPLVALLFSIFRRIFRIQRGKSCRPGAIKTKQNVKPKEKQKKATPLFCKRKPNTQTLLSVF